MRLLTIRSYAEKRKTTTTTTVSYVEKQL